MQKLAQAVNVAIRSCLKRNPVAPGSLRGDMSTLDGVLQVWIRKCPAPDARNAFFGYLAEDVRTWLTLPNGERHELSNACNKRWQSDFVQQLQITLDVYALLSRTTQQMIRVYSTRLPSSEELSTSAVTERWNNHQTQIMQDFINIYQQLVTVPACRNARDFPILLAMVETLMGEQVPKDIQMAVLQRIEQENLAALQRDRDQ